MRPPSPKRKPGNSNPRGVRNPTPIQSRGVRVRTRGRCKATGGKVRYASSRDANWALQLRKANPVPGFHPPTRIYQCPECADWHMASSGGQGADTETVMVQRRDAKERPTHRRPGKARVGPKPIAYDDELPEALRGCGRPRDETP